MQQASTCERSGHGVPPPSVSGGGNETPAGSAAVHSRAWVEELRPGHPRHEDAVATLRDVLRRFAVRELCRRREQLATIGGPELDDLAQQAASDALLRVLDKLDRFRGESRFTTWAYRFVAFEVRAKVEHHAWRRHPPAGEPVWDQVPDAVGHRPDDEVERREQLRALSVAIKELTERQRQVFVAVALNLVPVDVLAVELGATRNAIYKNLFDARRSLRSRLAAAGHPV